jgi:hypothetical protein
MIPKISTTKPTASNAFIRDYLNARRYTVMELTDRILS